MRLVCKNERDDFIVVELEVRNQNYYRIFSRQFNVQTKEELLATLDLLFVSLGSTFEEVPEPEPEPEPEETVELDLDSTVTGS